MIEIAVLRSHWHRSCATAVLAATLLTAACATPQPMRGVIEPSYVFPLGANKSDVLAMLGHPQTGPRFDRYSNLTEAVYTFPFRAVKAESRLPDGSTRVELVDTIHFFFNHKNQVEHMAFRTNRYYPSFTDFPVQKVTVLPRLVDTHGRIQPVALNPARQSL